ncbi:MAG TPA: hypothetical protein VMR06_12670 [Dokdonella sp.]|uniref:hypothetical protein n=1 Tax=Dokdonella sp. TaxID=2291710 RepID=UPI002C1D2FB3|nr:hypothetical protein [Dokdonella sp.]HUD42836.1 hypothetical protein [Dokdonella sp.]
MRISHRQWTRYLADVGLPMLAYLLSVLGSALFAQRMPPGPWRMLVAALPVPAIAWLAYAEWKRLRRRDELRQRIELEAMTIGFGVSFAVVVALVFLDLHGGVNIPLHVAAFVMAACWIGAQIWVRARYRYGWLQSDRDEPS